MYQPPRFFAMIKFIILSSAIRFSSSILYGVYSWYNVTSAQLTPSLKIPSFINSCPSASDRLNPRPTHCDSSHMYVVGLLFFRSEASQVYQHNRDLSPTLSVLSLQGLCYYRPAPLQISLRSITPLSLFLIRRPSLPPLLPAWLELTANL